MFDIIRNEFISTLIGLFLGFLFKLVYDKLIEFLRNKPINKIFRTKGSKLLIIHSTIFDEHRNAYEYPACDTKVVRLIATELVRIGMKESIDFFIYADIDVLKNKSDIEKTLAENDLVLICSPKRNEITKLAYEKLSNTRYRPIFNMEKNLSYIKDNLRKIDLISTEDLKIEKTNNSSEIDYGIFYNSRSPFNKNRKISILSGNHGEGTLGAAEFIVDSENLKKISKRSDGDTIEELIVVKFKEPDVVSTKKIS